MRLMQFNIDEEFKDVKEVVNPKVFESGKFTKGGLFSQQIFGPCKSYTCACNTTMFKGRNSKIKICPKCGVEITSSATRRQRFAKIVLPFPVLNPLMYIIITKLRKVKNVIDDLLSYEVEYCIVYNDKNDSDELIKVTASNKELLLKSECKVLKGLNGVVEFVKFLADGDLIPNSEYIRENYDKLTIRTVPVIPPDFRPTTTNSNIKIMDDLNSLYLSLLVRVDYIKKINFSLHEDMEIFRNVFRYCQAQVIEITNFALSKLGQKEGLFRNNILGKRIDFSGRAVISPDPTLNITEVRIPYYMILEIWKPQLSAYFVMRRVCNRYNKAVKLIEDELKYKTLNFFDLVNEFITTKKKICIVNRQPTLHRMGILSFYIKLGMGYTIGLHPLTCPAYNADFDGDQMAIYMPVTDKAYDDSVSKLFIGHNLISPTDASLSFIPNQDIVLGIYSATKCSNSECAEHIMEYKGHKLALGRYLFNQCLPKEYPVIDFAVGKKELIVILNDIALHYPSAVSMRTLDSIKNLGFTYSTLQGYSISIGDLWKIDIEKMRESLTGNLDEDIPMLSSKDLNKKLEEMFPISEYIVSGARGSFDQFKQIVLSRGYVSDVNGYIRPNLIRDSLTEGLTKREFFDSCWGARKGLLDTALSAGQSGYLTRQLIYSTIGMELGEEEDCGSTDYLSIYIDSPAMAKTLLWRYYFDDSDNTLKKITKKTMNDLVGKTIKLRSPIFCKNNKICKKCYGDLRNIFHSDQAGIIASQALGERTLQLILQTFHTGGVAKAGNNSRKQNDIICGLAAANKLFHKPGNIKSIKSPLDLVLSLYNLFNEHKSIHMVHYEIAVSSMMITDSGTMWRLEKNRNEIPITFTSILIVPELFSWLLGTAFSNIRKKIIDGLVNKKTDPESALSRLFKF